MIRKRLSNLEKKTIYTIAIIVFVLLSLFMMYIINRFVSDFKAEPQAFRQWINGFGIFGPIVFVGMVVLQVVFAIVPGEPFEVGAGYAFGTIEGVILSVLGFLIGSIIIFTVVRKFNEGIIEVFFSSKKTERLKKLIESDKAMRVLFVLFVIPGTPKDLITYVAALTNIRFSDMIFLVSIARLPSLITSVIAGDALGEENMILAIVVFVSAMIVSIIGALIYSKLTNRFSSRKKDEI